MLYFDETNPPDGDHDRKPTGPGAITEQAVGQRHGSASPDAVKENADISQEELARRLAASSGAQASIPEKTAESVDERAGDAYSDPESVEQIPKGNIGRLTASSFKRKRSGRKAAEASVFRPRPRCRPHRLNRAHSPLRHELFSALTVRFEGLRGARQV
jgi:hypothetical protein